MKSLKEYILENKNNIGMIETPEICSIESINEKGIKVAYQGDGDPTPWVVLMSCYVEGGSPQGCNSLEILLKEFDTSGVIKEQIESGDLSQDKIVVGCVNQDDERETMCWLWGKGMDEVCYDNEPKK